MELTLGITCFGITQYVISQNLLKENINMYTVHVSSFQEVQKT